MCYYAEWDERFQQAAAKVRESQKQAERLVTRVKEKAAAPQPTAPAQQPATERNVLPV